jgi:Tol biopolymer transport system component
VFTSSRTGLAQLYAYDLARQSLGQLTFDRDPASGTTWARVAPDGRTIAVNGSPYPNARLLGPDGTALAGRSGILGRFAEQPWSPDGRRLLAESSFCGPLRILSSKGATVRELAESSTAAAAWSPDGRLVAWLRSAACAGSRSSLMVGSATARGVREVVASADFRGTIAWAPDGRRLAVVRGGPPSGEVWVVPVNGGAPRKVSPAGVANGAFWSPAGGWIAYVRAGSVEIVRPDGRGRRIVSKISPVCTAPGVPTPAGALYVSERCGRGEVVRWSRDGRRLALSDRRGLRAYEVDTGRLRALDRQPTGEIAWSPSGKELAYEATTSHALRIVDLAGRRRTLRTFLPTSVLGSLQWTPRPAGAGAKPIEPVELFQRASTDHVQLREGPVEEVVASGDAVAYLACRNIVSSWQPSTGELTELLPEWAWTPYTPYACTAPFWSSLKTSGIALSDLGVAYWRSAGGNTTQWSLFVTGVSAGEPIASWSATSGGPPWAGWTVGDSDLLVFGTRELDLGAPSGTGVRRQTVWRVREHGYRGTCPIQRSPYRWETQPGPCQELSSEPGPLVPVDVDQGRIVALRDNDVVLLSGDGARLLTVPGRASAATLSGSDLVVVVPGRLRRYDAATGRLRQSWPLPDVPVGGPCNPIASGCPPTRLQVDDSARGLVAYALDGEIHVLRLADGADRVAAAGSVARFLNGGLVLATSRDAPWVERIRFLPDEEIRPE